MGKWNRVQLGDYLVEHTEKTTHNDQYPVLTSSREGIFLQTDYYKRVVASKDTAGYNVVPYDYFTYRHMSDDAIFRFNINNIVEKGIVSTLYPVFTTRNVDDCFLQTILNYGNEFKKFAFINQQGLSRTYVYFSMLKKLYVTMPALAEQRRIAAVLTAADEAIASSRALVEKYLAVKQGFVADLLGHGEKVSLKKLGGRFIRGHGITRADIQDDGVPCIRYGELYTTYDVWLDKPVSHVSEELAKQCLRIKHGDLLFTLSGETAEEIGKTVAYLGEDEVAVGGDLTVFTGHKQNPLYLSYILNAPDALKQKELRATGSMVVHINSKKIEEVSVPLPPLPEQERIAEILMAADEQLTAEQEHLAKLEKIKLGLMDDLLTNRVSTDKL